MWLLLAGSLLLLQYWLPLSLFLFIITLMLAANNEIVTPVGITIIILMSIISYLSFRLREIKIYKIASEIILVLSSIALTMHLVPGFNNVKVLDSVDVGPQSAPFTMYYNIDKAIIPFLLLACLPTLFKARPAQPTTTWLWFLLILSVPVLLASAVFIGGLRFETHRPVWIWQFMLANLFFVSLTEEGLFRGYLQQRLTGIMSPNIALVITSALFGLLHYAGGVQLIIFAGLSGIIYGLAWMWSGRLWVATLFHFFLNLTHLLFFTYPIYLSRW